MSVNNVCDFTEERPEDFYSAKPLRRYIANVLMYLFFGINTTLIPHYYDACMRRLKPQQIKK
ncbi:hypothetical protein CHU_0856 [Cytophaga hutchinsonii ATCC 33406]|uniref:Uncharacterized protein n=1 Tax=Cytophaga hutchinsonii (strain ATCC 33406 / DSM 1761 / CIP 103989 / NBRC 15051 / NCIMB 9469 / D465) TaxID=269798 RepID=A0A6N4SP88_CYTH3|nr:hypothetical protein CHU_0856 [Cytophaga hutchinsonii ATCC 33406]